MTGGPEINVEIRWTDVDSYGHVSHMALIGIAEHARSQWLDTLLAADIWAYVVVHLEIDFRAPAVFADRRIGASIRAMRVGESSIRLQEVLSAPGGRVVAELETVVVAWDESGSVSRRLTPDEVDRLARDVAE